MCRIQVLKRGRWDFFSALPIGEPFFFYFYNQNHLAFFAAFSAFS